MKRRLTMELVMPAAEAAKSNRWSHIDDAWERRRLFV
jgi:hypothetical protein